STRVSCVPARSDIFAEREARAATADPSNRVPVRARRAQFGPHPRHLEPKLRQRDAALPRQDRGLEPLAATPETARSARANRPRLPRVLGCCRASETGAGFGGTERPRWPDELAPLDPPGARDAPSPDPLTLPR